VSRRAVVIDDDPLSREFLVEALRTSAFHVEEAPCGEDGVALVERFDPELVLTDLRLPGIDGVEVLRACRERNPELSVIVLTAFGTVECAVEAMKAGAEDFLLKPVSPEQIELVLGRLDGRRRLEKENRAMKASLPADADVFRDIIGGNRQFIEALQLAERVATSDATILVRGDSGTGKELVAGLLHRASGRRGGPFIRVNCAALTESLLTSELFGHEKGAFTGAHQRKEGRFELASGGTLFLDEIGEMPLEVQGRLLRVLESGEFERVGGTKTLKSDARIVAATNRDLEDGIE
jgi:DNA-binding NtrC family response regulator